jgi:predicted dehydrogenase
MLQDKLRTVLVGAGKIGLGYADDPIMARHYSYAAHAQVLSTHDRFAWVGVIDPSDEALNAARRRWGVSIAVNGPKQLPSECSPEVAVIATGPGQRREILDGLPSLRAVLVEKPLGANTADAQAFVGECRRRNIVVQVNLWRRADSLFRRLAGGMLADLIGPVQAVFGVYGNGLINNGTHMVDFVRMLLGEVSSVSVPLGAEVVPTGPIPGDVLVPFSMRLASGKMAMFQPIDFHHYRENSLDLWGEVGRLAIYQEGLRVQSFSRVEHRAMQGEHEVASDRPTDLSATVGDALYHMYTNLADAVASSAPLWSPPDSALTTTSIVDSVFGAARAGADK